MKKLLMPLCALAACAAPIVADEESQTPKIAVMKARDTRHNNEYDRVVKDLGWSADHYENTREGLDALEDRLDGYDFVITVPLFGSEDAQPGPKFKKYLEDGGTLVMTDAAYPHTRAFLDGLGPDFGGLETGDCNSSQWAVNGYVYDADPPHPTRFFPKPIVREPNSWPHFLKPPAESGWRVVAYCSEGFPVTFVREVGKGMVIVTALRQSDAAQFENYRANTALRRSGFRLKSFEVTPMRPGNGRVSMELESPPGRGARIVCRITDAEGRVENFPGVVNGTACGADFKITKRGPIEFSLFIEDEAGRTPLLASRAVIPRLLEVEPNTYRGILSTARRLPNVDFPVRIAPLDEDLRGARIAVSVFDAGGKKVASAERAAGPDDLAGGFVSVPMDRKLPAGGYAVKAALTRNGAVVPGGESGAQIKILAPVEAQTIIDEDSTFLVGGEPFFPIGIYHVPPSAYPRLRELGFNAAQFWQWDANDDNIRLAVDNGIKIVPEMNHRNEDVMLRNAGTIAKSPAVLMWYSLDEPAEGSHGEAVFIRETYHRNDEQHPVFLLSCRPDIFREQAALADVFGHDPYGTPAHVAEWTEKAVAAVGGRKATVAVLASFGEEKPEAMRAGAYAALAHGTRGIFWYPWSQVGGGPIGAGIHNVPELQEAVAGIIAEIRRITPGLLSTVRRPFKAGDTVHAMVCGDQPGQRFLIMVNTAEEEADVDVVVAELARVPKAGKLFAGDKPETVGINGGRVLKRFAPREVLVYNW